MAKQTTPITPHKGGRTAMISARVTEETRGRLSRRAKLQGVTMSDLIEELAHDEDFEDTLPMAELLYLQYGIEAYAYLGGESGSVAVVVFGNGNTYFADTVKGELYKNDTMTSLDLDPHNWTTFAQWIEANEVIDENQQLLLEFLGYDDFQEIENYVA